MLARFLRVIATVTTAAILGITPPAVTAQSSNAAVCQSAAFQALQPTPLGSSPLTIRSLIQGDQICFEFGLGTAAPANAGWFAVGLARSSSMVNSPPSNVMLYISGSAPKSYYLSGYTSSAVVEEPSQSFFTVNEATMGPLKFSYQRSLAASSQYDVAIDANQSAQFIWAYGTSWPISGHQSGTYGAASYNFATGASQASSTPYCTNNNCTLVVGSIAFAVMLVCGLVLTWVLSRTAIGRVFLHRTLASPPVKSTTNEPLESNPITMFRQNLADLRVGELFMMLIFVGAIVALVIVNNSLTREKRSGQVALLILLFMILPVARIPLWSLTFGASFERIVKFHRWLGMLLIIATLVHLIESAGSTNIFKISKYRDVRPFWGTLGFIMFVLIGLTANEYIRRKFFEVFYFSHRVLSVLGFVFCILHAPKPIGMALIAPLVLYGLSLLNRWWKSYSTSYEATVSAHEVSKTTTLMLNSTPKTEAFAREMNLCSYFWVQIPAVSGSQWHPFSGIATPTGDSIGFCVRAMSGDNSFTGQLFQRAKSENSLILRVSGPFGKISLDVDQYDIVLLIGGGVGITPLLSAINQRRLLGAQGAGEWEILWSVRHPSDLLMVDSLMPPYHESKEGSIQDPYQTIDSADSILRVHWHLHCSAEKTDGTIARSNGEHLSYRAGIPVLDEYINSSRFMGRKVAVLACGPPTMVVEAQALARDCGFDFHKEVFNW